MTDPAPAAPDRTGMAARLLPWIARAAWVVVAVVGGAAVEGAVDDRSSAVRWVAAIGGWTGFAAVAVALLIPSVTSLTVVRVVSPLALVAALASAVGGATAAEVALLAVPAIVAVTAIFTAEVGRWMVQASAYGDEHRLPLRSPAPAGAAAVVIWLASAVCVVVGPLALAARNWALGVPLTLLAIVAAVFVGPRWHRMSRRWLVLVPAGLVVHDPVVLADTLMVKSHQIAGLRLALAGTEAADLTGPAGGHALEISTTESVSTVFAFTPHDPNGKAIHMTAFLVAPSRPGEALRLAAARRLPIR